MKIKKLSIILTVPCLMFLSTVSNAQAVSTMSNESPQPRVPICTPTKYYEPSSVSNEYRYDKEGEFRNAGAQVQSKTITYSTTYTSTVSSNVSAEMDLIAAKLNASLQTSMGVSKTVTLSSTFNISPKHVGYYKVGQKRKKTNGYIVTVYDNCTTRDKYVSATYSFGPYDSYSEKNI